MSNIAIIWDFDGTLTPSDSTSKTLEALGKESPDLFWEEINHLRRGKPQTKWEHILASNAPIWMYTLSRIAHQKKVPLNKEFFKEFVVPNVELYSNVITFLRAIKNLEDLKEFKDQNIKIDHFIISAGLKELIEEVMCDQERKHDKRAIDKKKDDLIGGFLAEGTSSPIPKRILKTTPKAFQLFAWMKL